MHEADVVRAALVPVMLVSTIRIWRSGRNVTGRMLMLIGALHLTGLWVGRDPLVRILTGGVWGQADSAVGRVVAAADQELVFWFTCWGLLMIVLGELLSFVESKGVTVPPWFGYQFFGLNMVCAVLLPKAGFWWVLIPAYRMIRGR